MNAVGVNFTPPKTQDQPLPYVLSKRKLEPRRTFFHHGEIFYPSPPMSNPPSPPRPPPQYTVATSVSEGLLPTTANIASTTSYAPGAYHQFYPTPHYNQPPPFYGSRATAPQTTESYLGPQLTQAGPVSVSQAPAGPTSGPPGSAPLAPPSGPSGGRGGRKSKAHVASACINCKRAHLSCDVQRPCARCVSSGKQVSSSCLSPPNSKLMLGPRTHATMFSTRSAVDRGYATKESSRSNRWFRTPMQGRQRRWWASSHLVA